MLRHIALSAVAALMTAGAALANPGWTTQDLNFRVGPGSNYPIIAAIPACDQIHVYDQYGGWYKVSYRGHYGWVSARYVAGSNGHCYYPQPVRQHQAPYRSYTFQYNFYGNRY